MDNTNTHKGLLLLGDGLGDRLVPELGDRTPLEAARTPTLDRLAREGETGLLDPIAPGIRAGSDTAHLSILGYDPFTYYTGRGPFEAMGIGLDVQPGDVAFRCNFSTVNSDMVVVDRRAGRINEGTVELARAVDGLQIEDVTCLYKESIAHRGALVLRGAGLGVHVTDVDPHADGEKILEARAIDPDDEASAKTARILNAFVHRSYEILNDNPVNEKRRANGLHPANIILPRGIGPAPKLSSFSERTGLKGACIVEVGLVKGIGKYVGLDVIDVPGATGGVDTDTEAIGRAVIDAFKDHDFVLCNVKGPDIAGHDMNPAAKVEIIEKIDAMTKQILDAVPAPFTIFVSGDHCTPVTYGDHTGEAVPFLFWGPATRADDTETFGERACGRGSMHRISGRDVVPILTSLMGVQEKFGA
jgi:2,3-bisphosphoglycerate-independent phosphoglycerate mutase